MGRERRRHAPRGSNLVRRDATSAITSAIVQVTLCRSLVRNDPMARAEETARTSTAVFTRWGESWGLLHRAVPPPRSRFHRTFYTVMFNTILGPCASLEPGVPHGGDAPGQLAPIGGDCASRRAASSLQLTPHTFFGRILSAHGTPCYLPAGAAKKTAGVDGKSTQAAWKRLGDRAPTRPRT